MVFVSPVFPTRSHPDEAVLGEAGALALALMTRKPAIALGGMDAEAGERLMRLGWAGWAAIDAWLPGRS
jgi:thiamine-phosphate pyrophosphorylase